MAGPEERYVCKHCGGELFFVDKKRSWMRQKNIWWLKCKTCMETVRIMED